LSLKQIKTGVIDEYNKHEQLELRGGFDKAAQSVLPPSFVVDNLGERTYKWLDNLSPQDVLIADLPEEVLVYWLTICNDLEEKPVEQIEIPHNDDMIAHLAETLHQYYPILNYDEWIRVSWAFKNSAGEQIASDLMRYYYPEKQKGEYKKLFRSQPGGKKCTLGTIRYMIKKAGGVCANNESEIKMCELMNKTTKKHQ
jgi:hypothetical protein